MAEMKRGLSGALSWPRFLGGASLLLVGVAAGLAVARYGLALPLGLAAGLFLGAAAFFSPWTGLGLAVVVAFLLPFGVLPLRLGLTPSFLEVTLLGTLGGWALPPLLHGRQRWHYQALDGLAWSFVGLSMFSLVLGLGRGVNATVLHNYAKTFLAMATFFAVRQLRPSEQQVRRFLAGLLLAAGLAASLGLLLHALPDPQALQTLTQLGPVGYPTSGRVLRYVEDNPRGLERAIGTSVDPNSFGGALAMAAAIALGEVLACLHTRGPSAWPFPQAREVPKKQRGQRSASPALPFPVLLGILLLLLLCLYLTYSRAALGGFMVAALFLATARYRRLWWGIAALAVAASVLIAGPAGGSSAVERLRQGIAFQDLANQMRLAEYKNALRIMERYPVFGVGFGQAPDVDLTTGVSSLYLTIAEHMGLVGLVAFLSFVGAAFFQACRHRRQAMGGSSDRTLALLAGLVAALAIGLLDHYFFNLEFPHMVALFWTTLGLAATPRPAGA